MFSYELDVPIYFSSNATGSGAGQDWTMECRMVNGVCTSNKKRNLAVKYLVAEKIKQHAISFFADDLDGYDNIGEGIIAKSSTFRF